MSSMRQKAAVRSLSMCVGVGRALLDAILLLTEAALVVAGFGFGSR